MVLSCGFHVISYVFMFSVFVTVYEVTVENVDLFFESQYDYCTTSFVCIWVYCMF